MITLCAGVIVAMSLQGALSASFLLSWGSLSSCWGVCIDPEGPQASRLSAIGVCDGHSCLRLANVNLLFGCMKQESFGLICRAENAIVGLRTQKRLRRAYLGAAPGCRLMGPDAPWEWSWGIDPFYNINPFQSMCKIINTSPFEGKWHCATESFIMH